MSDDQAKDRWLFNRADVAEMFGVTVRTINRRAKRGQFPESKNGHWDIRELVLWMRGQFESEDKTDPNEEYLKWRADMMKTRALRAKGALIPRDSVQATWSVIWAQVRESIEAISSQCQAKCGHTVADLFLSSVNNLTKQHGRLLHDIVKDGKNASDN